MKHIDYDYLKGVVDEINDKGLKVDILRLDTHINNYTKLYDDENLKFKELLKSRNIPLININSIKESRKLFFEDIGLSPVSFTKTGPSLDEKTLSILEEKDEVAKVYKRLKSLSRRCKLISNIKKALKDGRIYSQLNLNEAVSGRFTMSGKDNSKVNIQQWFPEIRDIILPD